MKLSNAEGTPEELSNFFQNNGLNPADYFQALEAPLATVWIIVPAIIVFVALAILALVSPFGNNYLRFTFVMACLAALWLGVAIQIRYKNEWATGFVIIGCLALTLVAIGVLSPLEAFNEAKALKR